MNIHDVSLFAMKSLNSKEIHCTIKQEMPFFEGYISRYIYDNVNSLRNDELMKAMGVKTTRGIVLFWKKNREEIEELVKEGTGCRNSLFNTYRYAVVEEDSPSFSQFVINQVRYAVCFDVTRKIVTCLLKNYSSHYALYHRLAGTMDFMDGGGVKSVDGMGIQCFFEGLNDVTEKQRAFVKSLELARKEEKRRKKGGGR